MSQTKRRIEIFSFYNQTGITTHLEKMARKGWMIERITNFGWIYRQIEPRQIHFSISYYPKASAFDPEPTEGEKLFQEFCAHTGWKLACSSAQLQIFYNEAETPIPIQTEPRLELEAIHATAKRSFLPSYFLLLAMCFLQCFMFVSNLLGDPIGLIASPSRLYVGFCFLLLTAIYLFGLISYLGWYRRAKRTAEHGALPKPPDTSLFQKVLLYAALVGGIYYLINIFFSGDPMKRWLFLLMALMYPLLFISVSWIKEHMKRRKASKGLNQTVTMSVSFFFAFILVGLITNSTLYLSQQGFFASPEEETYEHRGMTWVIHKDELPLTVEDLTDIQFDGYIRERRGDESLFLGQLVMRQWPRYDADDYRNVPKLEYTMVIAKMPFLYEICKDRMLWEPEDTHPSLVQTYQTVEAAPWKAREAFRLHDPEYGPRNQYLLCYDHVIVEIDFSWEPSQEQMAIVGKKLGG